MSERPIEVGDLVYVAMLPTCGCDTAMGWTFVVDSFIEPRSAACVTCFKTRPAETCVWPHNVELRRLKRIPPLADLEGKRTEENIREDALTHE